MIREICIVGGGNMGHYLIAVLQNKLRVTLLTSRPNEWQNEIELCNTTNGEVLKGKLALATDNTADVIPNADMILVTVPSHAVNGVFQKIKPHITANTIIGFIPGTGGKEYLSFDLIDKGCTVWGSARVPSGTSIVKYGKRVNYLGNRKDLRIAAVPYEKTDAICILMNELLGITTIPLDNYLCVTLTPSNQILHTSRLYSILKNHKRNDLFDEKISLYKKWDNESSEILLGCDSELQDLIKKIDVLDLSGVLSLKEHYEIATQTGKNDCERMTNKISILPFSKDSIPMIQLDNKFQPDFQSRYFLEDYPYGLCIVKSFCVICGVESPTINRILRWYSEFFGKMYFVENDFIGKDLAELPLPQNFGIKNVESIYTFYAHGRRR
jgi:hypothetical protein